MRDEDERYSLTTDAPPCNRVLKHRFPPTPAPHINSPQPHWTDPPLPPPTKMYLAGIMNHFSEAPKMELIVWGSTMAIFATSACGACSQLKRARSKAGGIKLRSTGPRLWTSLAFFGQSAGLYLLPLVYWTATASNKFHQPKWMTEYALPSLPDILGVDGVTIGRTVGLLGALVGAILSRTALKALGDQCSTARVSASPFHGLSGVNRWLTTFPGYR